MSTACLRRLSRFFAALAVGGVLAAFVLTSSASAAGGDFIISGRGYGHAEGMSQWGAWQAAREGVKYDAILAFYYPGTTLSQTSPNQTVKVRLTKYSDSSWYYNRVDLHPTVTSATLVSHDATGDHSTSVPAGTVVQTLYSGGKVQVVGTTGTFDWVELRPDSTDGRVGLSLWATSATATASTIEYWGTLRVEPNTSASSLRLYNTLLLDRYVRSIGEVDPGWANSSLPAQYAPECVKAQATAARTYAMAHGTSTDLYDNTNDQVYAGYTWEAKNPGVAAAADATAGVVITYGGKPINAYFSTHSGGYLSDSAWSDNAVVPYLVAKADPWSLKAPAPPWTPPPGYAWTVTISPATLASYLGVSVGTITNVEVLTRDTSDPTSHARTLRITGTSGTTTMAARTFKSKLGSLGLKSTLILSIAIDSSLPRYQQTDPRFVYAGTWATFSTASASGGSYKRANTSGASVTVKFTGTYLAWIATAGTTLSKAYVSLDGGAAQSVNLARSAVAYQQKVWTTGTLASGPHTVKIWWDPVNAAGKYISVDAFDVAGTVLNPESTVGEQSTRYQQTDPRFVYAGTWATFSTASASGGNYKRANTSGASVTVKFTGTYLAWIATAGTTLSKAYVSLDGGAAQSVNLARSAVAYQQKVWTTGTLASGPHTVKIWWDPVNAAGKYISVDAFDVLGTLN